MSDLLRLREPCGHGHWVYSKRGDWLCHGGREVVLRRLPWPYESKVTAEEIALYDSGKPLYVVVDE